MFTIGRFAALTGVSAKRLRHYDRIGLFRPAWVDPVTRYRFYTATQLPDLRRIVSLIDLGLPLSAIAAHHDRRSLQDALRQRRDELERQRTELDRRLSSLDIRLGSADALDVVVRKRDPARWVAVRRTVERGADLAPLFVAAEQHAAAHGVRAAQPPACIVHGSAAGGTDVEVLVPVVGPLPGAGEVRLLRTPAAAVAASLVIGGYDELAAVAAQLVRWAGSTGRAVVGHPWHVYLRFSAEDHLRVPAEFLTDRRAELVTEVQVPISTGTASPHRPGSGHESTSAPGGDGANPRRSRRRPGHLR